MTVENPERTGELIDYIRRHMVWSFKTFGFGRKTEGVLKHIEKEIAEVRQNPQDLTEWVDIMILAIEGAWRNGHASWEIWDALVKKQVINFEREWPKNVPDDQPVEHIRGNGS